MNWVRVGPRPAMVSCNSFFTAITETPDPEGYGSRAARLTTPNNHSAARVRQDAEALVRTRCEARLEEWLGVEAKGKIRLLLGTDLQNFAANRLTEVAIVTNINNRTGVFAKCRLELFDTWQIQVVCRLV